MGLIYTSFICSWKERKKERGRIKSTGKWKADRTEERYKGGERLQRIKESNQSQSKDTGT